MTDRPKKPIGRAVGAVCLGALVLVAYGQGRREGIGNPVLPGWNADPEIRIFEGHYYIYPTVDDGPKEAYFDVWVSTDLKRWEKRSRIFDFAGSPWTTNRLAWAPSVARANGRYYLYFGAGDGKGIGVAVADSPEGPFRDALQRPLVGESPFGAQPIDPMAFLDDDGRAYLYFGGHRQCAVARLGKDMTSFVGGFKQITPEGYVEAPFMFKRRGIYYLSWSEGNWMDATYGVAYAKARSPYGPFRRIGKILQGDDKVGRGAGHHSVLRLPNARDEWVIAYHRRPVEETAPGHRVVCIERLRFDRAGNIEPVRLTFEGIPRWPLTGRQASGVR